jgi:hypothetical protein
MEPTQARATAPNQLREDLPDPGDPRSHRGPRGNKPYSQLSLPGEPATCEAVISVTPHRTHGDTQA